LHKVTGRVWIDDFCKQTAQAGIRLYLLGGKPGVAKRAAEVLQTRYPELVICGTADGYFHSRREQSVLEELTAINPDILLVGMGTPKQELWITERQGQLPAMVCWSVGTMLDYLGGREKSVPVWLDNFGLEWLWRLAEDPGGKWRRYLIGIPGFALRDLHQKFANQV